ncbi:protein JTB [Emydura macquarii macquarii]|uniref:protein JTB n=1 Tax=Emydura macquarii macquarii TaxID=1129001 RepID=UPI00352A985F
MVLLPLTGRGGASPAPPRPGPPSCCRPSALAGAPEMPWLRTPAPGSVSPDREPCAGGGGRGRPAQGWSQPAGEGPEPFCRAESHGGGGATPWATPLTGPAASALPVVPRAADATLAPPLAAPGSPPPPHMTHGAAGPRWRRRAQRAEAVGEREAGPVAMGTPALLAALSALAWGLRPAAGTAPSGAQRSVSPGVATQCWRVEDFVVTQECVQCMAFQAKTIPECSTTGFIEQVNCVTSKKEEYKSCRSAVTEAHSFWKFEGAMVCVAVVFGLLVMCRQRALDRKALEKVRKQIESI